MDTVTPNIVVRQTMAGQLYECELSDGYYFDYDVLGVISEGNSVVLVCNDTTIIWIVHEYEFPSEDTMSKIVNNVSKFILAKHLM